jgi:hypothetical protein
LIICEENGFGFHIIDIPNEATLDKFLNIINSVEPTISTIADNVKQSYAAVKANSNSHSRNFFKLLLDSDSDSDDEMDVDLGALHFGGGGFGLDVDVGFERLMLQIQLAELLKSLTEALENKAASKISNNTSSFFGNSAKKRKDIDNENLFSEEQMAKSAFGQASNTAKRFGH